MPELRVRELVDSAAPKHGKVPPHLRGLTRKLQNKIKKTKHRKVPPHLRAHAKDTKKKKHRTVTPHLQAHAEVPKKCKQKIDAEK